MRKTLCRLVAVFLCVLLVFQNANGVFAEILRDPTEGIVLSVPTELQDGADYFFIRENSVVISENSKDKVYIPIQRTGNLDREGEITLKLIDLTSRHDVNYKAEIFREHPEEGLDVGDMSVLDVVQHASYQEEFTPVEENELGQAVYDQGGAEVVDAEGDKVGDLPATPVDEAGNPIEPAANETETEASTQTQTRG